MPRIPDEDEHPWSLRFYFYHLFVRYGTIYCKRTTLMMWSLSKTRNWAVRSAAEQESNPTLGITLGQGPLFISSTGQVPTQVQLYPRAPRFYLARNASVLEREQPCNTWLDTGPPYPTSRIAPTKEKEHKLVASKKTSVITDEAKRLRRCTLTPMGYQLPHLWHLRLADFCTCHGHARNHELGRPNSGNSSSNSQSSVPARIISGIVTYA